MLTDLQQHESRKSFASEQTAADNNGFFLFVIPEGNLLFQPQNPKAKH